MVRELESDAFRRHPALIEIKAPDTSEVPNLNEQREKIVSWLIKESKETEEGLRIERLRRFLSADLTRYEIELLASNFASQGLEVHRLWKNAQKRALITRSVDTVQARPAHLGYGADGRDIRWAILDSGIRGGHPHFGKKNIEAEHDCTKRGPLSSGGTAFDGNGHGTHVAGIIAGVLTVTEKDQTPEHFSEWRPRPSLSFTKR